MDEVYSTPKKISVVFKRAKQADADFNRVSSRYNRSSNPSKKLTKKYRTAKSNLDRTGKLKKRLWHGTSPISTKKSESHKMKFVVVNFGEDESDWKFRRRRRMMRYGKLFQGRVVPGLKGDKASQKKAGRTIAKIKKSAEKWSARGAKGGAGGKIRSEPKYMKSLIKSYSKKQMSGSKKPGTRWWKESNESLLEAWKRAQRRLRVAKIGKAAAKRI